MVRTRLTFGLVATVGALLTGGIVLAQDAGPVPAKPDVEVPGATRAEISPSDMVKQVADYKTRMEEMRIQVFLHKQKNFSWPIAETSSHWITLGMDKDLNIAMANAARNAIKFLSSRAHITELDAYALCSIAVSFRVTQVVDIVRGVHAMIPKSLFTGDLRKQIAVV